VGKRGIRGLGGRGGLDERERRVNSRPRLDTESGVKLWFLKSRTKTSEVYSRKNRALRLVWLGGTEFAGLKAIRGENFGTRTELGKSLGLKFK